MPPRYTPERVADYWKHGKTLPLEALAEYPFPPQEIDNDTGVNVLVDLAHQCNFTTLWRVKGFLNENGYRYVSTHACLDTVLTPGAESRVRLLTGQADDGKAIRPFGWWPNCEYNVVVSLQSNLAAQRYLPEELEALDEFLQGGGGLILIAGVPGSRQLRVAPEEYASWPLREVAQHVGADLSTTVTEVDGLPMLALDAPGWDALKRDASGRMLACRREVGKGRVVLVSHVSLLMKAVHYDSEGLTDEGEAARLAFFGECLAWASGGKKPVGGTTCLPSTYGGGGSIYPELEQQFGSLVVFYTKNQKPEVLDVVEREFPLVQKQLFEWLPSEVSKEPLYLLLASGMGGGWAVNAFYPKENGIAAYDRKSLLGIFAHELAHTMGGPRNARGELAGVPPHDLQGEAHAGWFQGKIYGLLCDEAGQPVRGCNEVLEKEAELEERFDLVNCYQNAAGAPKWGRAFGWTKLWYLWQKLDDRYGPTWYPRWYWIRATRWTEEPDHRETWEELVEDMSLAVGEDLFPFFRAAGASLARERLGPLEFQGQVHNLPVAPLTLTPAGPMRLEAIGDYMQPLPNCLAGVSRSRSPE